MRLLGGVGWEDRAVCPLIEPFLGRKGSWERLPNEFWRWHDEV